MSPAITRGSQNGPSLSKWGVNTLTNDRPSFAELPAVQPSPPLPPSTPSSSGLLQELCRPPPPSPVSSRPRQGASTTLWPPCSSGAASQHLNAVRASFLLRQPTSATSATVFAVFFIFLSFACVYFCLAYKLCHKLHFCLSVSLICFPVLPSFKNHLNLK